MTELQNNAKDLVKALSTLRRIKTRLNPYCDLNYGEMSVFAALMKLKDISEKDALIQMAEISREMDISKPALSQIVNKLEDKGLVERVF
ncbi:MAG: helix-turn-helix domain-containing protein, partial [Clostridiales bacterium]